MTTKNDIFDKYYASDIFNQKPYSARTERNSRIRNHNSTLENTKEEIFNISKERRIHRNLKRKEPENESLLNRSMIQRKNNLDKIYGSDIFNSRKTRSVERRRGKLQIQNNTQKSTFFEEMKNNDEYIKDLKYYTNQHRGVIKKYNPDIYLQKETPQERYYKNYYENHVEGVLPGSYENAGGNMEKNKMNYVAKKINLQKNEKIFNDVGADKKRIEGQGPNKELRYAKNHPITIYKNEKRRFVGLDEYPENNCKINKQIQFESHIFNNDKNNYIKTNEEIKEINERIEREKHKRYNINVLGQPYINANFENNSERKGPRLRPANIEWSNPQAEVMFGKEHSNYIYHNYGPKPNAYQLKLYQNADSENIDTLSGLKKTPFTAYKKPKKEQKINNETSEKIEEMVNNMPNLNDGQKLGLKMKTSVLDCNNDNDWNDKIKTLNNFYTNENKKPKLRKKEVTEKVNNIDKRSNQNKDQGYHNYVITYSNRQNQFDKFDEYEIKNIFGRKGVNIYDINKNPFNTGNYNTISFKVVGNDNNEAINKKLKMVQDDLKKKNYKVNIEEIEDRNNKKNTRRMVNKPGWKSGIILDYNSNISVGSKFAIMPNEYKKRKGFTKEFAGVNYAYKRPLP